MLVIDFFFLVVNFQHFAKIMMEKNYVENFLFLKQSSRNEKKRLFQILPQLPTR
jgi:hypothetical protein